ncbi:FAD-dependent oxidoreductase [Actinocorallia sp. A-T 12471]|uniref:FAD-dependent oxidoreductase n=1 Tax=Actinocorallia sp. A-T 12471 TaxID=3089813 RepID=UPI0029D22B92|nr:FAD-dependent oxidoreductase [Actinocorallia sp. A-T 12471]MDX6740371.1 FAD-dependent oxidoreductase [Actinocorallia sp. A-T 12471]
MSDAERPVLLSVDDDPSVSRAVARDLRRKYGQDFRVIRAETPETGLDALKELKLKGARVAVILADYRMPEMSGIEFLETAMDIYPRARRALLTAYADTDAAIAAINVVDVDHYLLKPWDPPEEKLYPVVDAMIDSYLDAPDINAAETKVIGHRWSPPSFKVRDFLARNAVPYRWFQIDEPEALRLLQAANLDPTAELPVVVTPDGGALVAPSTGQLASAVGLATTPETDLYDLVVVGGGPAGLGAAVYGASEGLRTLLVERYSTGGQAGQSSRIENYLGFPDGVSGGQLTDRARRQAVKFGTEILTSRDAVGLRAHGPGRVLVFGDGREITAHTVIIATGVQYRELDAPGVAELTGRGVYYGSAMTEAASCQGDDVYIVGGANSAGQAAVFFSRVAKSVTLLVRGRSLEDSMSYYLIEQLRAIGNVRVRLGTTVAQAHGSDNLEGLTLRTPEGAEERVEASHMFVFIGAQPRTDWLADVVERDEHGFIRTGADLVVDGRMPRGWPLERDPWPLESSLPGVFVAGDVRAESVKRVASAVGDGAMAVSLAHRYLGSS